MGEVHNLNVQLLQSILDYVPQQQLYDLENVPQLRQYVPDDALQQLLLIDRIRHRQLQYCNFYNR